MRCPSLLLDTSMKKERFHILVEDANERSRLYRLLETSRNDLAMKKVWVHCGDCHRSQYSVTLLLDGDRLRSRAVETWERWERCSDQNTDKGETPDSKWVCLLLCLPSIHLGCPKHHLLHWARGYWSALLCQRSILAFFFEIRQYGSSTTKFCLAGG